MKPINYLRKGTFVLIKSGKFSGMLGIISNFKNQNDIFIKTIDDKLVVVKKKSIIIYKFSINFPNTPGLYDIGKILKTNKKQIMNWFKYRLLINNKV